MDKVEFISAQHVKIEFEMASVLQRGLAYVLDTAIGYVYLIIVMLSLIDSVRLAYSDMDAGGNAVAVEQMSINYEGFDTQWGPGTVNPVPNPWGVFSTYG